MPAPTKLETADHSTDGRATNAGNAPVPPMNAEERHLTIEKLAHMRAAQRAHHSPGSELDDWLWAERQVDGQPDPQL